MKVKNTALIVIATALGFLLVFSAYENSLVLAVKNNTKSEPYLPIGLKIPKINVDAKIEDVGLIASGAMGVPKGPDDVAWFELGTKPGEIGSSVIAGHTGWKNNIPAVFDNLNKLEIGDEISVQNTNGEIITFVVREIRTFDSKSDSSEVFGSSDGKSHLNLVTCTGVWNEYTKSSSERLVVFADRK